MDDASDKSLRKNERVVPESEVREMQKRIRELERLAGKQAMKRAVSFSTVLDGCSSAGGSLFPFR